MPGGLSTTPPYSREATVAAVQDYFALLTDMYLDPEDVLTPPAGGWPSSTIDKLQCMGKTPSVLDLLRHLPYIPGEDDNGPQSGFPDLYFADWRRLAETETTDPGSGNENTTNQDGYIMRECSEPSELVKQGVIPPYVIGLTYGGWDNPILLLDTQRGIVHWYDCPMWIQDNATHTPVTEVDDPFDWADTPEGEAAWRWGHPAWGITDFFGLLKRQLLELRCVPVGSPSRAVLYADHEDAEEEDWALVAAVRAIYRRHGWPDRASFDKEACLREVKSLVKEEYPDLDYLYDDEDENEEGEKDDSEEGDEDFDDED